MYRFFKVPEDRNVQRNSAECNVFLRSNELNYLPLWPTKISPAAKDKSFIQARTQIIKSLSPDLSKLIGNNVIMPVPVILSTKLCAQSICIVCHHSVSGK